MTTCEVTGSYVVRTPRMRFRAMAVNVALTLGLLAVVVGAVASAAEDASPAMAKWGLLGTWSSNCAGPPTRDNPRYTWVRHGALAFLDRDYGDARDSNRVLAAAALPGGAIELLVEFKASSQTRVNIYVKGDDGRIQMFVNHDIHGNYSVRDGKLVDSGGAPPWDTRCR
jgi:hypothetical protein